MAGQRVGISFATGLAVGLSGVAGLSVSMGNAACPLSGFIEIPLRAVVGGLSSVIFATWQLLVPCLLDHTILLECLLQVTTRGWRIFLAFTGAA